MAGPSNPQSVRQPGGGGGVMAGGQNIKPGMGGGRPMGMGGPNQFTLGQTAGAMMFPPGMSGPNTFNFGPDGQLVGAGVPQVSVAPRDPNGNGGGGVMAGGQNIKPGMGGGRPMGVGGPNQFTLGQTAGQGGGRPMGMGGPNQFSIGQAAGGVPGAAAPATPAAPGQPAAPAAAAPGQPAAPAAAAPGQPNVFTQAAGAYNTALQGPNISQFMNPYTQEVMNRTAADINAAQQQAMNQLGQQASTAGAFGGSRHGIAEAQTNAGFTKQLADTSANLNMQGFNTALGAAQNQQQMMSNLAQQGFGFGQSLNQQQMQQGALQQAMQQMLIDAAKGQYAGFTGAPGQALTLPMAAVGAANMGQQTQTTTNQPGLFDYLSLAAGTAAGMYGR